MTALTCPKPPAAATARRPGVVRRLVAWLTAPGLHAPAARTLADIGASQTLRAQAELREAQRHGAARERWRPF